MKTYLQQWEHWWMRDTQPHSLALFRIAFGLFLILYTLTYAPYVSMLFSTAGVVVPFYDVLIPSAVVAWITFLVLLVFLVLLTIGYATRICVVAILLIGSYFWVLNLHLFTTSYLRLFIFFLSVLLLGGSDSVWSLRMKFQKGSWSASEPICILPQRLLAMQISAVYLGVGWQKVILPDWQGAEVLTSSFITRWGTPPAYWLVRQNWPIQLWDAVVFIIKLFECTLPFGLWIPSVRKWFMAGGALFHILITVLLGIWWFLVLIPAYVVFYERTQKINPQGN